MNSSSKSLRRLEQASELDLSDHHPDASPTPTGAASTETRRVIAVWDLPVRIFHWSLALAVTGAVVTGEIGGDLIEWHGRCGLATAGLIAFRLCWGIIGPANARFANFVRGPASVRAYLRGEWQGLGHNPLGALAVVSLLGLTALQVITGLFANDDISFQGPLATLISTDGSARATGLHTRLVWLLFGLIALHLAAIAFYRWRKGDDLVGPMLSGRKRIPDSHPSLRNAIPPEHAPGLLHIAVALLVAGLVVLGASGQLLQTEPIAAPSDSPPAAARTGW